MLFRSFSDSMLTCIPWVPARGNHVRSVDLTALRAQKMIIIRVSDANFSSRRPLHSSPVPDRRATGVHPGRDQETATPVMHDTNVCMHVTRRGRVDQCVSSDSEKSVPVFHYKRFSGSVLLSSLLIRVSIYLWVNHCIHSTTPQWAARAVPVHFDATIVRGSHFRRCEAAASEGPIALPLEIFSTLCQFC
jgi:hypothetical protein